MPLTIFTSSVSDGSVRDEGVRNTINKNGRDFLSRHHIEPAKSELVYLDYSGTNYCRYNEARGNGDGVLRPTTVSDALVTLMKNVTLVLPLADCIGAVIHDPTRNILMLSHLGRHNLEQNGGTQSILHLMEQYGCDPADLTVWLSPAAGNAHYPLFAFGGRSMHGVATEQLLTAGISKQHITLSPIDTTIDNDYYSHSEFLKGNREIDGRFAVICTLN